MASRKDYLSQLNASKGLLDKVADVVILPLVEGLQYKCEQYINLTTNSLTPEDELHINEFLRHEIISFLKHVIERYPEFQSDIHDYFLNIDPLQGQFHQHRKAYETTLNQINKNIVFYLEDEVKRLQEVYPFYFEKYRSDGVEYNIYIGQSIVPAKPFDQIYLKNIRFWQLKSMADIVRLIHKLQPEMMMPLQITQLILVHSQAIAISFRKDERRFDVEGSYNIRYEIIKKRIDKVRIKDSLERLTQPGCIALVYTNMREIDDYLEHIKFLQKKGLLNEMFEMLDLEELQGVSGLKAIRIGVKVD